MLNCKGFNVVDLDGYIYRRQMQLDMKICMNKPEDKTCSSNLIEFQVSHLNKFVLLCADVTICFVSMYIIQSYTKTT